MPLEPRKRKPLTQGNPLHDLKSEDLAPHRQCPATSKRTGERCKNMLSVGKRTCRMHGSATTKSKMAAAKRIAKASGYAAELLVEFMADPKVDVKLRTTIAQDLLSRANVTAKTAIELTVPEWEKRVQGAATAATVDWGSLAALRTDDDVIDAELVEAEAEAHERAWDERLEAPRDLPPRQRPSEVQDRIEAMPVKPPKIVDDEQPPWIGTETGSQHAERLADEHRRRAFEADKATKGLAPRTRRKR